MDPRSIRSAPPANAIATANPALATTGTLDTAAALLVVQAGFGLVSTAGLVVLLVMAGGAPIYLAATAVALLGPILAVTLAVGLTRARRWARRGAVAYEAIVLLHHAVRLFFDREVALGLVVTLSSVVLPLAIGALVLGREARRATAPRRRDASAPAALDPTAGLQVAA